MADKGQRVKVLKVPEDFWFRPSTHPRLTQDEMEAFATTLLWAVTQLDAGNDAKFVQVACPCCQLAHTPQDLLTHVVQGEPPYCDREAWGRDESSDLVYDFY